ncbi:MAG: helix-turn-helix transcriptional regulator [Candidatus Anstonellales archaeon]
MRYCPERIRKRRLKLKLTQAEVAKRAGTAREYFNEVERGKAIPKVTTLAKIADALDVRVGYFFVNDVCNN